MRDDSLRARRSVACADAATAAVAAHLIQTCRRLRATSRRHWRVAWGSLLARNTIEMTCRMRTWLMTQVSGGVGRGGRGGGGIGAIIARWLVNIARGHAFQAAHIAPLPGGTAE